MTAISLITILAIAVIVVIFAQGHVNFVTLGGVITATNLDGSMSVDQSGPGGLLVCGLGGRW
jgi:hypothetical protein